MKEKDIWLSPEEVQALLQGTLQWSDLEEGEVVPPGKAGLRGQIFAESAPEKQTLFPSDALEAPADTRSEEEKKPLRRLEGMPVILLLGGVGLLTLSSWCYFVLFV